MCCISALPVELLLIIFGHLSPEELLDNVWNVCSAWREIVQHPLLWQDYVYSPPGYPTCKELAKFVEKCPMLKHVRTAISTMGDLEAFISTVVRNCTDVRTFCIDSINYGWTASQIDILFEKFPNLEALTITVDCMDPSPVVETVCKFTNLKELNLRTAIYGDISFEPIIHGSVHILEAMKDRLTCLNLNIPQEGSQQVVDALSHFTKLENLVLFHDSDYTTTVNFLPLANLKTLKCLEFSSTVYDVHEMKSFFDALFCYPLQLLCKLAITFSHCELPETVVEDICRCYPNLKCLELYGDSVTHTFDDICGMEHLESLKYNNNGELTDEATEFIARCPRLKHLDLEYCTELTDATVTNLANCKSLESLNLKQCSVSGKMLHLIPEHLKNLRYLNLAETEVEQKDLDTLAKKMPLAKIIF